MEAPGPPPSGTSRGGRAGAQQAEAEERPRQVRRQGCRDPGGRDCRGGRHRGRHHGQDSAGAAVAQPTTASVTQEAGDKIVTIYLGRQDKGANKIVLFKRSFVLKEFPKTEVKKFGSKIFLIH